MIYEELRFTDPSVHTVVSMNPIRTRPATTS